MLTWFSIIGANLLRQKLRTLVTAVGVAVAIGLAFCILAFQQGYQNGVRSELDRLGAHLLVVPKGCPYDAASIALHGASWPCYLKSVYLETVRKTPYVACAAPVLMTALYDEKTGAQRVYCGVEQNILQLRRSWKIDGAFPLQSGELLIGAELAHSNQWRVGQTIVLPGVKGGQGRISGILRPTQGADDLFVYMPLTDAQRYFRHPGELTHILVQLTDPERVKSVVEELRGCDAGLEMTVVPLAHLFQTIQQLVENTRLLLGCVALAALLAAGAGVSNTILMAVSERTREIGVLRAIGASPDTVFGLIWAETMLLCLVSGIGGLALAALSASAVEVWLRRQLPYAPESTLISLDGGVIVWCMGICLLLGTFAALLPAWRAARLSPVEAIRQGAYTA
jgi:putative ABC transport system permease protein